MVLLFALNQTVPILMTRIPRQIVTELRMNGPRDFGTTVSCFGGGCLTSRIVAHPVTKSDTYF